MFFPRPNSLNYAQGSIYIPKRKEESTVGETHTQRQQEVEYIYALHDADLPYVRIYITS